MTNDEILELAKASAPALWEAIGLLADRCDNLHGALSLPLPAAIHVEQMKRALPELRDALRTAYVVATGENPWTA